MCSTGKSNPYTSQICLSTPPALQHCFSAQAGLGGRAHLASTVLSPLTATLCPMHTNTGTHGHWQSPHREESFPSLCWVLWAGKLWLKCWKNLFFYIRNWMNMCPWQAESRGAEVLSFFQWILLLLQTSKINEFCCSHFIWLRHRCPRQSFCHQNHQFAFNHSSSHLNNMTCQNVRRAGISHRCTSFEK